MWVGCSFLFFFHLSVLFFWQCGIILRRWFYLLWLKSNFYFINWFVDGSRSNFSCFSLVAPESLRFEWCPSLCLEKKIAVPFEFFFVSSVLNRFVCVDVQSVSVFSLVRSFYWNSDSDLCVKLFRVSMFSPKRTTIVQFVVDSREGSETFLECLCFLQNAQKLFDAR